MTPLIKWPLVVGGILILLILALRLMGGNWLDFAYYQQEKIISVDIPTGATFTKLMASLGVSDDDALAVLEASKPVYDLSTIVSGKKLTLALANVDASLSRLIYQIDTNEQLIINRAKAVSNGLAESTNNQLVGSNDLPIFSAAIQPIPYEVEVAQFSGVINKTLYGAFVEKGEDERLVLALAEILAWQVDFAADIREGDTFSLVYEKRFLDEAYVRPGKILAASFTNDGRESQAFYFESENTKAGYYDENGYSVQKQLLKTPLQYKYISSGFSYARLNPVTRIVTPHRAIDYAANYGTPVVTVGDGTVTQAGWNGNYGISVTVRHNDMYKTIYGHLSSLAKGMKSGAKVAQGQVIGYVGDTGQTTGPHLHYEMYKFGSYVNPLVEEIPPGEPIAETDRVKFTEIKDELLNKL